jgi:hypothetical protein
MTLTLELPNELETELSAEATQLGLKLPEYVLRLLTTGRMQTAVPRSGAELVAYWRKEEIVGARQDIADSQAHARELRRRTENRERP